MQVGYEYLCKAFVEQPLLKSQLHLIFPVHQEKLAYLARILASQPLQQIRIIAMCAQGMQLGDFGVYFMRNAEDMHFPGMGEQAPAQRFGLAVTCK